MRDAEDCNFHSRVKVDFGKSYTESQTGFRCCYSVARS